MAVSQVHNTNRYIDAVVRVFFFAFCCYHVRASCVCLCVLCVVWRQDPRTGTFGPILEETLVALIWKFKHDDVWRISLMNVVFAAGFAIFAMIAAKVIRHVK